MVDNLFRPYYNSVMYTTFVSDVESMERKTGHDICSDTLQCLLWWTCRSEIAASGLSKTGIITVLINLLRNYIQRNIIDKV